MKTQHTVVAADLTNDAMPVNEADESVLRHHAHELILPEV